MVGRERGRSGARRPGGTAPVPLCKIPTGGGQRNSRDEGPDCRAHDRAGCTVLVPDGVVKIHVSVSRSANILLWYAYCLGVARVLQRAGQGDCRALNNPLKPSEQKADRRRYQVGDKGKAGESRRRKATRLRSHRNEAAPLCQSSRRMPTQQLWVCYELSHAFSDADVADDDACPRRVLGRAGRSDRRSSLTEHLTKKSRNLRRVNSSS